MRFEQLADGSLKKCYSPIAGMPFYSDWLEALLLRGAAFVTPTLRKGPDRINPETGLPRKDIIPYDRYQEQRAIVDTEGKVKVLCLGCATPCDRWDMGKIKVGGLTQYALIEPIHEQHGSQTVSLLQRWRQRSVSKAGLGCMSCWNLYTTEVALVEADNRQRALTVDFMRKIYLDAGQPAKAKELKDAKAYTAWIDILTGSVKAMQFSEAMMRNL